MTFSDDDLYRLKRETDDIFVYEIRQVHIKALLARLEAAEDIINDAVLPSNLGVINPLLVDIWRGMKNEAT